jgi:hypothetical protein
MSTLKVSTIENEAGTEVIINPGIKIDKIVGLTDPDYIDMPSQKNSEIWSSDGVIQALDTDNSGVSTFLIFPETPESLPISNYQVANKKYVDDSISSGLVATAGDQNISGIKTFTNFPVTPSAYPSTDYQVANKKYVDDKRQSYAILQNRRDSGDPGGSSIQRVWTAYPLVQKIEDVDSIITNFTTPNFTVAEGTYKILASFQFYDTDKSQTRLVKTSDPTVAILIGQCTKATDGSNASGNSILSGTIIVTESTQLQFQYYTYNGKTDTGLGIATGAGGPEVYGIAEIVKIR